MLYRTLICFTSDRNPQHTPYVYFLHQDLLSTCNTFRDNFGGVYFRRDQIAGVILEGAKYTQGVSKIINEELETYNVEIKNR